MTVQTFWDSQLTGEIKPYTTDVTAFLPSGVTAVSGSAAYSQTFGGSAAGTFTAVVGAGGSDVTMTTPALAAVGEYDFTVSFTLTNGNVRKVMYKITVPK